MKPYYSVQMMVAFGFFTELILNNEITSWALFFIVAFTLIGISNFIIELKEANKK